MTTESENHREDQPDFSFQSKETEADLRFHDWLQDATIEIYPDPKIYDRIGVLQDLGRLVSVANSPDRPLTETVQFCTDLAGNGIRTKMHIAARGLTGEKELFDTADVLLNAGIRDLFVIGGDWKIPNGPFTAAIDVLYALHARGYVFDSVGVGIYPGGHPEIPDAYLDQALRQKQEFADRSGMNVYGITQLHLSAAETLAWVEKKRAEDIRLPFRIGAAAPMSIPGLLKFMSRCSVKDAMRMIASTPETMHLALEAFKGYTPDSMLRQLAESEQIHGIHLFTMNALERTTKWLKQ